MVDDLAEAHGPIGDLLPAPLRIEPFLHDRLTSDQVAFYHQQGYLAGLRLLDEDQVGKLRDAVTKLMLPEHDGQELWYERHANESAEPDRVLFHALGAWRIQPDFHDLLWHPRFTVPASQLLGGAVRFWHDQLFCKPAYHGGVVAWHQDYSYWTRTRPVAHLTCWIALDDSTRDNGCVHYVPGSHRWELLPITGLAGDMESIRRVLHTQQWQQFQKPVAVELRAGECTFHHPLMIHGSFENRTSRPRRATVINVVRDGVCSASDAPLLEGVPAIPSGQPMGGPFFPLLADENGRPVYSGRPGQ